MNRKQFLSASFVLAETALATKHAHAQTFPTKQITIIVPPHRVPRLTSQLV